MTSKAYARKVLLPKVGDQRLESPTVTAVPGKTEEMRKLQPCRVIEVNTEHLWYMVQFENGVRECYKVPRITPQGGSTT